MHGCVIVLTAFLNLNLVEVESYTPKALELLLTVSSYPAYYYYIYLIIIYIDQLEKHQKIVLVNLRKVIKMIGIVVKNTLAKIK